MKQGEVKMKKSEMIYDIKDLNGNVGKNAYLLIVDDILIGSTRKSDINDYLADENPLLAPENYDQNDVMLLYGLVLNIKELPYELPKELEKNNIWVFQKVQASALLGMVECEIVLDMQEATEVIEKCIATEHTDIDDFAIIIGYEMDLIIQIKPGTFQINARHIF